MRLLELFQTELKSLVLTLVSAGLVYLFRARVKLLWAIPHGFTFLLQSVPASGSQSQPETNGQQLTVPTDFNVYTGSIIVGNVGRVPASEVEITFNWKPDNYNIWPVRPHDVHISPDTRYTLKFANLAPDEQFQIELISATQLPNVLNVRCRECVGKQVGMKPMVVYGPWVIRLFWAFVLLGIAAVIYSIIKFGGLLI